MVAGLYVFSEVLAVCKTPLEYRIGSIDERFGLDQEVARNVIDDATSIWEDATGRNLFTYDDEADFTINFVFDERQREANEADALKDELDTKQYVSESINETYERLAAEYDNRQASYESLTASYERKLRDYNTEVEHYNQLGGAPPDVFEDLENQKDVLDRELKTINSTASALNTLAGKINQLGEKGNALVDQYNSEVETYNNHYGTQEEFTQGDYQGDLINIYTYSDYTELTLVLAHELGHSLSLDHVENSESIMYYLMGDQPTTNFSLTIEDLGEFQSICGDEGSGERFRQTLIEMIRNLGVQ